MSENVLEQLEEYIEDLANDEFDEWFADVFVPMYLFPNTTQSE